MTFAVIGLGFGDEGKGLMTDYLLSEHSIKATSWRMNNPVVVRYSGGQQAAHTVTHEDKQHVFSNFGSGTLRGVPTYWSKYCTVDPVSLKQEYEELEQMGVTPRIIFAPTAPVTTPWDKYHNQNSVEYLENGTCGYGVGATMQREEDFYHLKFQDLLNPMVFRFKLDAIKEYYGGHEMETTEFISAVRFIRESSSIGLGGDEPNYSMNDLIFEGSQGLLLDQHYGFFPHVTRANTGTKNLVDMGFVAPQLFLVTRAYQTRHGHGPMSYTQEELVYDNFDSETNQTNKYQGEFRRAILDIDLLRHGIESDKHIRENRKGATLVVTCVDQLAPPYKFASEGLVYEFGSEREFLWKLRNALNINSMLVSRGPKANNIERFMG